MANFPPLHGLARHSFSQGTGNAARTQQTPQEPVIILLLDINNSTQISDTIGELKAQELFAGFFDTHAGFIREQYRAVLIAFGGDSVTYALPHTRQNTSAALSMTHDLLSEWDYFLDNEAPKFLGTTLKIALESGLISHKTIDGFPVRLGNVLQATATAFKDPALDKSKHNILLGPELGQSLGYPHQREFHDIYDPNEAYNLAPRFAHLVL